MENNIYIHETPYGHYCLIENDLISENIKSRGIWEPHLYNLYSKMIKPEYYIIDGGANIGFHSVQFAKLASQGKVICYEVQNYIFNILSTNILINGLSTTVEQYRLGLGDDSKNNQLKISPIEKQFFEGGIINYGGSNLIEASKDEPHIPITGIDSLELPRLDFIKLDIQGMEYDALISAKKTLSKYKPILFLEAGLCSNSEWGRKNGVDAIPPNEQPLFDYLYSLGYKDYPIKIGTHYPGDTIFLNPTKHQDEINIFNNAKI